MSKQSRTQIRGGGGTRAACFNHLSFSAQEKLLLSRGKCSFSSFWCLAINISQFNLTDACCDTAEELQCDESSADAAALRANANFTPSMCQREKRE